MNRSGLKVSVEEGRAVVKCSNDDCHCVSDLAGLVAVVPSEFRGSLVAQVSVNDEDNPSVVSSEMISLVRKLSKDQKAYLHRQLSSMLIEEGLPTVAYRGDCWKLIASTSNVSTSDWKKVLEHRAMMGDAEARKMYFDLLDAPLRRTSTESGENFVHTKLVLRSSEPPGYEKWHRSAVWEVMDNQMTRDQIDMHFLEVDKMRSLLDDRQTNPIYDGETGGDRDVRLFCVWGSDKIKKGKVNEWPMKFHTDALLIDAFLTEYYHRHQDGMTSAQVRKLNDTVIYECKKKETQLNWLTELLIRRCTTEHQPNQGGVRQCLAL